jgi:chemotaxis methyl-accepting protein methylase
MHVECERMPVSAHSIRSVARKLYRLAKNDLLVGFLLLPYGRMRQRSLRQRSDRSDSHTYTSFYRSPLQLEALLGPVLSHCERRGVKSPSILLFAGSNGAEAYTIASELRARRPDLDFHIRASDLHQHTVQHAKEASYTLDEITQGLSVPDEFLHRTFDIVDGRYVVKPEIHATVSFEQADLLSPNFASQFAPADIVFVQNVLFHMPPTLARQAFAAVLRLLKPGSVLFIEGMELDMRAELTRAAGLTPLDYKAKEIYAYSRQHIPTLWWRYYFGNEPYFGFARNKLARYSTIFTVPPAGLKELPCLSET